MTFRIVVFRYTYILVRTQISREATKRIIVPSSWGECRGAKERVYLSKHNMYLQFKFDNTGKSIPIHRNNICMEMERAVYCAPVKALSVKWVNAHHIQNDPRTQRVCPVRGKL